MEGNGPEKSAKRIQNGVVETVKQRGTYMEMMSG